MPTVDVFNISKEKVGSIELPDEVFGATVKEHLFYTVVRYQLAARHSGTHKVKGRAEVAGGGRKPYKQKGTGRARQGTIRAPHMRGGGVVFGPSPRDYSFKLPKKVRRAALRSALSRRAQEQAITVLDAVAFDEPKTKQVKAILDTFGFDDLLIILGEPDDVVLRSARSLPNVRVLPVVGVNVYDVLNHKNLAVTTDAVAGLVQRLGR